MADEIIPKTEAQPAEPGKSETPQAGFSAERQPVAEPEFEQQSQNPAQPTKDDQQIKSQQDIIADTKPEPDTYSKSESGQTILNDTQILGGDEQFIGQVKRIIHDDAEKPYIEEEDSEELSKDYMKQRFGIKIDKDED